jgi:hypothetical protein
MAARQFRIRTLVLAVLMVALTLAVCLLSMQNERIRAEAAAAHREAVRARVEALAAAEQADRARAEEARLRALVEESINNAAATLKQLEDDRSTPRQGP